MDEGLSGRINFLFILIFMASLKEFGVSDSFYTEAYEKKERQK